MKSTNKIKLIPFIILSGIFLYFIAAPFLISFLTKEKMKPVYAIVGVLTILAPSPTFLFWSTMIFQSVVASQPLPAYLTDNYNIFFIGLLVSALIHFIAAIIIDGKQNNLTASNPTDPSVERTNNFQQLEDKVIEEQFDASKDNNEEIPVQAHRLFKKFKNGGVDFYATKDVSLVVNDSETIGLLGPNGAGKSTLFNLLSTYHGISSGEIKFFGEKANAYSSFFKNVGICTQDDILWPNLTIDQHLKFIGIMKNVPWNHIDKLKEIIGLQKFGNFKADTLSNGMKRKLCFLMCCMSNPKYKFLDECTTGLDPLARKTFRDVIYEQKSLYGGSCIFTTHAMNEAEQACDRVAILINGEICVLDKVNQLKRKLGGYVLTLIKKVKEQPSSEIVAEVQELLSGVVEEDLKIEYENEYKVTLNLPKMERLAQVFEKLEAGKENACFEDYSVKVKDLEDLFLNLAKYQTPRILS